MAMNLIEHLRSLHGEVNADKKCIFEDLLNPQEKHKKAVIQSHKIKARVGRIQQNQKKLDQLYTDPAGVLAEEEKKISSKNNLGVFYSRLNDILSQKKIINERHGREDGVSDSLDLNVEFSGEEFYGKYVEMNSLYQKFLNIKGMPSMYLNGIKKIDYKLYLETFDNFHNIPQCSKTTKAYFNYCRELLIYLAKFYERRYPLHPTKAILGAIKEDFEAKWAEGLISGWQKSWPAEIFQQYPSKSSLPLKERNKIAEKGQNPAEQKTKYCEPCNRDFKETVWKSHLAGRRHLKNASSASKKEETAEKEQQTELGKETACLEFEVKVLKNLLSEVFEETCYFIEKKLTRTFAEIQKELVEREKEDNEDDDDLGDANGDKDQTLWSGGVYNPKKVPLGWDGRPIPYWLYKFHGLNIGYNCEICGGTKYYGPRAFQQHFKEWKHAHGMKALGLPNTKHFHNITKIEEAEALYRKLKEKKLIELYNPDLEEEFEDQEGNVYGKQTYEALKRQRVI